MAAATYDDVAVAIGRPLASDTEKAQINWWLDGIELIIKGRLGDPNLLDQSVLRYVEVEAVSEKVQRRGQRESSITVSVDDGSVTRRYENQVTAGDISDEWWALLDPATDESSAFTVSPYGTRQHPIGSGGCW